MEAFMQWVGGILEHLGYAEIVFLMALESSLFPVPSELVMIPAGYLAAQGKLDPLLAIAAGGFGSVIGASANYVLGRYAGRAFLLRYGKYFLINQQKYQEAEALFMKNANWATFVGRLLPVIRHLISLPAGVFGMALLPFVAITAIGATLWCAILVSAGYYFGEPAVAFISQYLHEVTIAVVVLGVAGALWFIFKRRS
jgi:membrane protein DedA with SNARE-associated domain